jgi:hypothetical protein
VRTDVFPWAEKLIQQDSFLAASVPPYIEAVVPVHRLAHIALDREGRHVGEINSFSDQLRLKMSTEWKPCG